MIPKKFGLGRFVRLHDCCVHFRKIRHCSLNKSHHDYILPYNELFNILFVQEKLNVVQKSRFQVTKTLKIDIMKLSRNIYRTEDTFKIWIRQVSKIARLFYSLWEGKV